MINNDKIISLVSDILKFNFDNVEITDSDRVTVQKSADKLIVGGNSIPQKMRALTIAYINRDKADLDIKQTPYFENLGVMLDVSRGGVMRVGRVKEFILRLAMTGSNRLMLYTEDIFTLEDYPYFGYCRGRYTDEELSEIIAYGEDLGVELVPCIQTLGHMAQYLSWWLGDGEGGKLKDTDTCIMCDSKYTYDFIEAEIKKMKNLFKSNKIHIGMDEAHDMGLGKYLDEFGYTDRNTLLKRHLTKVCDICKKYDFEPIMWSDMFFRLASGGEYYDTKSKFSKEILAGLPDVDLAYWDYYTKDEAQYDKMIERHKLLGRPIVFAGASISYNGILPDIKESFDCTYPAMKSCIKNNLQDIWATMWGDDGCEVDYFDALYAYAMFSEMCYNPDCTMADIENMAITISNYTPKLAKETESYYVYEGIRDSIIWGDIFYKLTNVDTSTDKAYLKAKEAYEACDDEYVKLILKIFYTKADIYANMQNDYKSGADMSKYSQKILPELLDDFERLFEIFSQKWLRNNKVFGYEVFGLRFNTSIGRIKYAIKVISDYADGRLDKIEEFEYEPQYTSRRQAFYNNVVSGRAINYF